MTNVSNEMFKVIVQLVIAFVFFRNFEAQAQTVYSMSIEHKVESSRDIGTVRDIRVLPQDIPNRQRVVDMRFYPVQPEIFVENGVKYSVFTIDDSLINKDLTIRIEFDIELFQYNLEEARYIKNGIEDTLDIQKYLEPTYFQQSSKKRFKKLAQKFNGSEEEIIEQIIGFISERLAYEQQLGKGMGASRALSLGKGDCTEYTDIMVSLCRAKGIPARSAVGSIAATVPNAYHNWPEVYLKSVGWVPFDPTYVDAYSYEFDQFFIGHIFYTYEDQERLLDRYAGRTRYERNGAGRYFSRSLHTLDLRYSDANQEFYKYYNAHAYDSAMIILDELALLDLENTKYHSFRGMIFARTGEFDKALKSFQVALSYAKHAQQKRDVYYSYGNYLALKGDLDQSIDFLRASLELGFRNFDHMMIDEDLKGIRDTREFRDLLTEFGYDWNKSDDN